MVQSSAVCPDHDLLPALQHVMKWWQKIGQSFNPDGIRLFAYIIGVS